MFYLISFVICATNKTNMRDAMAAILDKVEVYSWKLTILPLYNWTSDIQSLNLDRTFYRIRPI